MIRQTASFLSFKFSFLKKPNVYIRSEGISGLWNYTHGPATSQNWDPYNIWLLDLQKSFLNRALFSTLRHFISNHLI